MNNAETNIKNRVDSFVNDLSELIRASALEAVAEALKKGGEVTAAPATRRPGRPAKAAEAPVASKPAGKPGRPAKSSSSSSSSSAAAKRRAGEKRSPVLLAQVTEQVGNHIKSNPGQGVEQIAKALSTTTKELTLPIRKLLGDKKITSKGQKRATRYFPK